MRDPVVVLGGGVAAAQFCRSLRRHGWAGELVLISEEQHYPYERPALTKSYLAGTKSFDNIAVLNAAQIGELAIDASFGIACTGIDVPQRRIALSDGNSLDYGVLVIATGLVPRRLLTSAVPDRLHSVRRIGDIDRLRHDLAEANHVTIVGGGWLGLEAASHITDMGKAVAVIEAGPRICSRNAPTEIADWLTGYHLRRGVDLRTGTTVAHIEDAAGRTRLLLGNGEALLTDLVIEATGVTSEPIPNGGALPWSQHGITVDAAFGAGADNVYAIGDIAIVTPLATGAPSRVETWSNAAAQAMNLAERIAGVGTDFVLDTWFWSDQSNHNIQVVGFPQLATSVETVVDEPDRRFYRYLRGTELIGAAAINEFRMLKQAKRDLSKALFACV